MSKINILEALRVSLTSIKNYINKNYYNTSEIDELLNEIELTPGPKGDTGEQGPTGPKGDKGNDGLTTSIIVNGATYNHSNGTITLPNYPSIDGLASEAYVQQQVAGIIDTAPETLNTLNELAQALGDDPNFATTIANQIGQKADKSELFSGSYNDLTNKPVIPSIQGLASESYVNQEIDNRLSGLQIVKITQAEYDALATKDPNTLYLIVE